MKGITWHEDVRVGGQLTFAAQVCLAFVSKNSKAPPPAWASARSMWRLAVGLRGQKTKDHESAAALALVALARTERICAHLRPQVKRRLCCTPSLSSCRVSSGFWM